MSSSTLLLPRRVSPATRNASEFTPDQATLDLPSDYLSPPTDETVHARHEAALVNYKRDPERVGLTSNKASHPSASATYNAGNWEPALEEGLKIKINGLPIIDEEEIDDQGKSGRHGRRHGRASSYKAWKLSMLLLFAPLFRLLHPVNRPSRMKRTLAMALLLFLGLMGISHFSTPDATAVAHPAADGDSPQDGFAPKLRPKSQRHYDVATSMNRHQVKGDGILAVNGGSHIHPIAQLIHDARETWAAKNARQSTTLEQAVKEYKRRHHRAPPKGFDNWWRYVCENNVPLPDEYDQITNDLRLFWALSPTELRKRIATARELPETWTLSVIGGSVHTALNFDSNAIHASRNRTEQQVDLIRDIAHYLPDFDVVYGIHDSPSQFVSYNHRADLLDRIEDREYFDPHEAIDTTYRGWQAACSSSSPLGLASRSGGRGRFQDPMFFRPARFSTAVGSKSFISDHRATMDPCQHPELISTHSVFTGKSPVVGPLLPIFSLSKSTMHADVLGVPTEQVEVNGELVPWEERREKGLLWRGRTTGPWHKKKFDWRNTQRTRLVKMANGQGNDDGADESIVTLLPSRDDLGTSSLAKESGTGEWQRVNGHYMNISYSGPPIQCSLKDGSCDALRDEYTYSPRMGVKEAAQFKYVIDIDGNAWSARFERLISSGSVVFKSTVFPEWWTDRIQPWLHYVPVKVDYTDLYDSLAFFRGDLNGRDGHEDLAKEIATASLEWSRTHWRQVDMTAYVFRLYLEWARLLSPDREAASLVYHEDMEVSRR